MSSELRWAYDNAWFWFAAILLATLLTLCLWNAHRHRWAARHVALEGLRFILALSICALLAKPESWQTHPPKTPATFLVLTDASASMDTADMDGLTRRQWTETATKWQEPLKDTAVFQSMAFESPDSGTTDLHAALMRALQHPEELSGIVLLSDGDWNAGASPQEATLALRTRGIPIIAVPVGRDTALPDIALTWLPMPKTLVVNEPTRLPFQIENRFAREAEVTIRFRVNDLEQETKTYTLQPNEVLDESFLWKPDKEGPLSLNLSTPLLPGETREDNNAAEETVHVHREQLNVLLVDSTPRWEFRYLRNALMRDPGVALSCILFHPDASLGMGQGPGYLSAFPQSIDNLTTYDVVFLGDIGIRANQLTETQADWLRGLVERQASGLVFLPGRSDYQNSLVDSPLADLLPVILEGSGVSTATPSALELTSAGRDNILTLLGDTAAENSVIWRSLPGFSWHAPVSRAKAGATVLAVHESSRNTFGRLPLLVTRPFGAGKVLYLATDGAWRWRRGIEDLYHYRFWSQVARWMAYQRNLAESPRGRIIHYPEAPTAGQEVTLHATLLTPDRGPMIGAQPTLTWKQKDTGTQGTISLTEIEGGWGVYRGSWSPALGGTYQCRIILPNEDPGISSTIEIASPSRENTGDAARPDVLRRLAESTKGQIVSSANIGDLATALLPLTKQESIIKRLEWWHHPATLTWLLIGLAAFWTFRKKLGLL